MVLNEKHGEDKVVATGIHIPGTVCAGIYFVLILVGVRRFLRLLWAADYFQVTEQGLASPLFQHVVPNLPLIASGVHDPYFLEVAVLSLGKTSSPQPYLQPSTTSTH